MKFLPLALTGLFLWPTLPKNEQDYNKLKSEIRAERDCFFQTLKHQESKKDSILKAAEDYLVNVASQRLFPAWYGTPWDFNGISQKPQEGNIACGYFVTNTLIDLGFKLPRYRWAQSASEYYIKKLCPKDMQQFSNADMVSIEKALRKSGKGLYLVGLDNHVGYLVVEEEKIRFVHSNYYDPEIGVMTEDLKESPAFINSEYHLIGKLFSDEMMENWIGNIAYK